MAEQAGYELLEHTADLAVRAWAPDLRGLIEQAARGMIDLMLTEPVAPERKVEVRGAGVTPEELLVDCLREMLLLIELGGLAPVSARVQEAYGGRALCLVGVTPVTALDDALGHDIKAVTYHDIAIRPTNRGLEVEVVFDV